MELYIERALKHELAKAEVPAALAGNALLSKSYSCLYKVSTCDGYCRGGDHIIEAITGRCVNQTLSALVLTSIGQYDEALSIVRSLGELCNLLAYFRLYPVEFRKWASASEKDRIKAYKPVLIRKGIEEAGQIAVPMDADVYSELCAAAVHVTPDTAPNQHSTDGSRNVGGIKQEEGEAKVLSHLSYLLPQAAMIVTTLVGRNDLLPPLISLLREGDGSNRP